MAGSSKKPPEKTTSKTAEELQLDKEIEILDKDILDQEKLRQDWVKAQKISWSEKARMEADLHSKVEPLQTKLDANASEILRLEEEINKNLILLSKIAEETLKTASIPIVSEPVVSEDLSVQIPEAPEAPEAPAAPEAPPAPEAPEAPIRIARSLAVKGVQPSKSEQAQPTLVEQLRGEKKLKPVSKKPQAPGAPPSGGGFSDLVARLQKGKNAPIGQQTVKSGTAGNARPLSSGLSPMQKKEKVREQKRKALEDKAKAVETLKTTVTKSKGRLLELYTALAPSVLAAYQKQADEQTAFIQTLNAQLLTVTAKQANAKGYAAAINKAKVIQASPIPASTPPTEVLEVPLVPGGPEAPEAPAAPEAPEASAPEAPLAPQAPSLLGASEEVQPSKSKEAKPTSTLLEQLQMKKKLKPASIASKSAAPTVPAASKATTAQKAPPIIPQKSPEVPVVSGVPITANKGVGVPAPAGDINAALREAMRARRGKLTDKPADTERNSARQQKELENEKIRQKELEQEQENEKIKQKAKEEEKRKSERQHIFSLLEMGDATAEPKEASQKAKDEATKGTALKKEGGLFISKLESDLKKADEALKKLAEAEVQAKKEAETRLMRGVSQEMPQPVSPTPVKVEKPVAEEFWPTKVATADRAPLSPTTAIVSPAVAAASVKPAIPVSATTPAAVSTHSAQDAKSLQEKNERLLAAATVGNLALVDELIQTGANIHYADGEGNTALHRAILNKHIPLARALISAGADHLIPNRVGQTPLKLAEDAHDFTLIAIQTAVAAKKPAITVPAATLSPAPVTVPRASVGAKESVVPKEKTPEGVKVKPKILGEVSKGKSYQESRPSFEKAIAVKTLTKLQRIALEDLKSDLIHVYIPHQETASRRLSTIFGFGQKTKKEQEVLLGKAMIKEIDAWLRGQHNKAKPGEELLKVGPVGVRSYLGQVLKLDYHLNGQGFFPKQTELATMVLKTLEFFEKGIPDNEKVENPWKPTLWFGPASKK